MVNFVINLKESIKRLETFYKRNAKYLSNIKRINAINSELMTVIDKANNARRDYYNYLYHHDREKWLVLDPVISVHPDSVIFEAFSIDESSYARVTVPNENLDVIGDMIYGTTNIDFSRDLVKEFKRVRNYRPAWIKVERDASVSP